MRILVLIAIGLFLYTIVSRLLKSKMCRGKNKPAEIADKLVACQQCGIHVLQQEAVQGENNDAYYCCVEHKGI